MRELPAGTVTFVFTDIEGSTRLLHELGDEYVAVLAEHRRLLRESFEQYGGVEVDTQGDAFFFAFSRAGDALRGAAAAQWALGDGPVRVRIGVHTGEPHVTDEGYVGVDVHRAARVMSAGHGGQIVISEATARLVDSSAGLTDLGEHRLKDLSAPERLYQLGDRAFPPLKTLYRTNLPVVVTPLVGRERELEEAGALLRTQRVVTLTGPGGSGKTRLAIHLAANEAEKFPDGVFWVPLQGVSDPAIVEPTVAAAIGAEDGLAAHVGAKRMLVLLDNFEQVVEAAPTVAALVVATPNAKVLVTSREPLLIDGEHRYPVDPLRPDDAEVLFEERARAVLPSFRAAREVAAICERLDGLPLAIELAAARVSLLEPAELLARLDQRLPLLTSRSRDAPARQRTLRAAIQWSYELLEPGEQQVFRRLGVFRGSFSLEAAEVVCEADLDTTESLVVKSLLRRRWGTDRVLLLDTIREYACAELDRSSEADEVGRRHAEYFRVLAKSANLSAGNLGEGGQRLHVAIDDQDNFRAALAWALEMGSPSHGLELATALEQFWVVHDPYEGSRWFEALFGHPQAEAVPAAVRAHALRAWGSSVHISGDVGGAEALWLQSLALFDQLGDENGRAVLFHRLGITAMLRGDLDAARERVETSHEIHGRNPARIPRVWGLAQTTGTLGAIAREYGEDVRAEPLLAESARLADEVGVQWWRGGMLAELAALSLRAGRLDEADDRARRSLTVAVELRDRAGRVFGVGLLAALAAAYGQVERAGLLWGAIETERAFAPLGGWQRHRDACEGLVRRHAGEQLDRARAAGRALELDEAVEYALSVD